jgi:hypothetical protein
MNGNGSNGVIWIMLSMFFFAIAMISLVAVFYAVQIWLFCQVMLRLLDGQFIRAGAWGCVLAAFVCADLGANESYTEVCVAIVILAIAATAEKLWQPRRSADLARQRMEQEQISLHVEISPQPGEIVMVEHNGVFVPANEE